MIPHSSIFRIWRCNFSLRSDLFHNSLSFTSVSHQQQKIGAGADTQGLHPLFKCPVFVFTFISDICGQRIKTPMSNIDISASIYCWGPLAQTRCLHLQLKAQTQLWAKKPLSVSFSVNSREKTEDGNMLWCCFDSVIFSMIGQWLMNTIFTVVCLFSDQYLLWRNTMGPVQSSRLALRVIEMLTACAPHTCHAISSISQQYYDQ